MAFVSDPLSHKQMHRMDRSRLAREMARWLPECSCIPSPSAEGGALCLTEGQGGPGVSEPDGGKVGRGGKVFARRTMIIEDRGGSAGRTEVIRRYLQKPNRGIQD